MEWSELNSRLKLGWVDWSRGEDPAKYGVVVS